MTKYFQRNKNISEPFTCYDCKKEKDNTKWFTVLNKENEIICLDCRNKWYQQNYQPQKQITKPSKSSNLNNVDHHNCGVYFKSSEKMTETEDNTVDLIITSPPYFNIKDYSKNGTQDLSHSSLHKQDVGRINDYSDYITSLLKVWKECERVLNPNGKICINVPLLPMLKDEVNTHHNRTIYDLQSDIQNSILKNTSLYLYDLYIWKRTNSQKRLMFGSYPYPRNFYNQNIIEFITVYVKEGKPNNGVGEEIKEKSKLTEKEWLDYTQQIWEIPSPNKSDSAYGKHPSIMPEEIVRRLVRLFTFERDLVLDPFAGSGTTLKAAKDLNRKWIGYEIYENYEEVIKKKLLVNNIRPPMLINKIYKLDVFDFLNDLSDNSVDLAIVDPPYNLIDVEWDKFKNETQFFDFTYGWIDKLLPKLKRTASIYIFNTPHNCAYIMAYLQKKGLIYQSWITWYKKDGFNGSKNKYINNQETILFFTVSDKYIFNHDKVRIPYLSPERLKSPQGILKNGKRWLPNPLGKLCPDVWEISSDRHVNKVGGKIQKNVHPSPKPEEIVERMVKASSKEGEIVLDLFSGTGTTSTVAKRLGRKFIGCESNNVYYEHAINVYYEHAINRINKLENE